MKINANLKAAIICFAVVVFIVGCTQAPEPNGGELCKWDLCWHKHKEPSE